MGSIPQRRPSLSLDLWIAELCGGLIAFAPITRLTGQCKVGDPVRASSGFGSQMFNLKGYAALVTVDALPLPLVQQIFPHLIPLHLALLILQTRDLRVLHLVGIEACYLYLDVLDR